MSENIYTSKIFCELAKLGDELTFRDFVNVALFHPELGYYRSNRKRVGDDGADFYTSESLKCGLFGKLMAVSARNILGREKSGNYKFIEIGAEPERAMEGFESVIRISDNLEIPQNAVVVSNELLDASPFDRFVFKNAAWQKTFLRLSNQEQEDSWRIDDILKPARPEESALLHKFFYECEIENFHLDFSFDALALFEKICDKVKNGVLIFADYFRTSEELSLYKDGTARAYFAHQCDTNLLRDAGERDLTFSPCLEVFMHIANKLGFESEYYSQENFFMKNAASEIEKIVTSPDPFNPQKRELVHLLNPQLMGSMFRILLVKNRRTKTP